MLGGIGLGATINGIIAERVAFNRMCDGLPKEEADKLKAKRRAEREEEEEHKKALEIADAGRARNFWGN